MKLDREKFYRAIFEYLIEQMDIKKAHIQALAITNSIIEINDKIKLSINNKNSDPILLSKQIHNLKNMLLYGDFYYESDLCQDMEIELRKSKKISNIKQIYDELFTNLVL